MRSVINTVLLTAGRSVEEAEWSVSELSVTGTRGSSQRGPMPSHTSKQHAEPAIYATTERYVLLCPQTPERRAASTVPAATVRI